MLKTWLCGEPQDNPARIDEFVVARRRAGGGPGSLVEARCLPDRLQPWTAPILHQKQLVRNTTNAIEAKRKRSKINEADRYPVASCLRSLETQDLTDGPIVPGYVRFAPEAALCLLDKGM